MRIQQNPQPIKSSQKGQPPAPKPPEEPNDRGARADSFYQGAASTSKWMSRIDGGLVGVGAGLKLGAVAGALLTGRLGGTVMTSLIGGAGLGAAGYLAMDAVSGFAGRLGSDLDTGNATRGEALGRTAVNVGVSVLGGHGWAGAVTNVGMAGVGGVVNYALKN